MCHAFKEQTSVSVCMASFLNIITLKKTKRDKNRKTSWGPHLGDDLEAQFGYSPQEGPNIFKPATDFSHFQETPEKSEKFYVNADIYLYTYTHICVLGAPTLVSAPDLPPLGSP